MSGMGDTVYRRCGDGVGDLIGMMDVIVVACQEFGLTVSEKNIEAMPL